MKLEIAFTEGPFSGKEISIREPGLFVFGRSDQAYFVFENDLSISRFHFLIETSHDKVIIRDLGSLNKTFLNDIELGGRSNQKPVITNISNVSNLADIDRSAFIREIVSGDRIRVGKFSSLLVRNILYDLECSQCGRLIETDAKPGNLENTGFVCIECQKSKKYDDKIGQTTAEQKAADFIEELLNKITIFEKPAELPALPGYNIEKRIGGGGNGDVYLGKSIESGMPVAVKVIRPEISNNRSAVERFIDRDINIGKQLSHENIVRTIESKFINGMYFIVMEYVEGTDLSKYQKKNGQFKAETACEIIIQTLGGLEFMHNHNVVHRDIKPENILLCQTAAGLIPKISDFGLAKNLMTSKMLTKFFETAGTVPYMPPEQIMDFRSATFVSDIFSLGASLYFMCTDKYVRDYPWNKDPINVNLDEKSIVPVEERKADIPPAIARVINASIQYNPVNRIRTAGEMKQALIAAIK
jgi:serine/threonine-protein kinase